MEKGYIMLSRKFFEHKIWKTARTFNESEAWLDLIQSARFEPSVITSRVGVCHEVTWGRGQYPASIRFLAKKWGWSQRKVRAFLSLLKKEKMVTIDDSQGLYVITLVNYNTYNPQAEQVAERVKPLNDNNLDALAERVAEHLAQKRSTGGAHKNKDNNNISPSPPPACAHTCEADFFSELRSNQPWLEMMAMKFGMQSVAPMIAWLNDFESECACKGRVHRDVSDVRDNFFNWLRIAIDKQTKTANGNNSRQYNTIEQQQRANLQAAAEHAERAFAEATGRGYAVFEEIP